MGNRFKTRRRNAIIAGCVFCGIACAVALSGGAQAALILSQVSATGNQFISGDSSLLYEISSTNSTAFPLTCGQEIVSASVTDSYLATGESQYNSALGLQNSDLIVLQNQRLFSFGGPSAYSESVLYDAAGAGSPEGGCGGESFGDQGTITEATEENETEPIPAVDPYCSAFIVSSGLMGSGLKYQSLGISEVGDPTLPDTIGFQFSGSGNGMGSLYAGSMSITPGYKNQFSERITAGGKPFTLEGKFQFTSFALTFDESSPTVEG